jgi:fructose PTS system EIIBC or EIIC component
MADVTTPDLVLLDAALGPDKDAVIRGLADHLAAAGRASDGARVGTDALAREATSATGLTGGLAIPHCRTTGVTEPALVFARLAAPVDFGAKDGPADLVFLIAAPEDGADAHLQLLSRLAQSLVRATFTDALRAASSAEEAAGLVAAALSGSTAPPPAPAPAAEHGVVTAALVALDADLGADKDAVIRALAAQVDAAGRTTDPELLAADALTREAAGATGLTGGLAFPHCRTAAVSEPTVALARLAAPVDFGAKDGPADLVFLIAAPADGGHVHLQLLAKLAQALVRPGFADALRAAGTPDQAAGLVASALG